MSEARPTYDDEIDLIGFFEKLWDGKLLISAFVAIAMLIGGGFLLLKDPVYQSKLIYSFATIPEFYNQDKVLTDFQNKFYSDSVFEEWKKNNGNTSIVFDDFSLTKLVDGVQFSKDEGEMLATLKFTKGSFFLLVNSNQPPVLDDFFKYNAHINRLLKEEYILAAKEELKIIGCDSNDSKESCSNNPGIVLSIRRYIAAAENGANVLSIKRPTAPKKVSPNSGLILPLSVFLGGMVGVFFILLRNAITKRKEQLVKV
jgi:capsular polysaccharide biosynthesis protein